MQLSAFFPFYRNHNVLSAISQEPYIWESVATATKTAMKIRYSILPYLYTLFYQAHTTGSTVMRALAWEFPNEPWLANADRQFLLGPSLMIVPVLVPQATSVQGVFPGVRDGQAWYDWYTRKAVQVQSGENKTIDAPLGHIPIFVRGGGIIPQQAPGYTTAESRKNPWSLLVALSEEGKAAGELYVDDGESLEPVQSLLVKFKADDGTLSARVAGSFKDTNALANVTILGVDSCDGVVKFNGMKVGKSSIICDDETNSLIVGGLTNVTATGAWSRNWTLTWE
jgi:alpha-glucosidase